MRSPKNIAVVAVLWAMLGSAGCNRAVMEGFTSGVQGGINVGVSSAIGAVFETLISSLFGAAPADDDGWPQ